MVIKTGSRTDRATRAQHAANEWFERLEHTYRWIDGALNDSATVKVAILDTGVEIPVGQRHAHQGRIESKSWLISGEEGGEDLENGDKDLGGHGTHAAALILKVVPNAKVYVARVFKGEEIQEHEVPFIAQATEYAVENWEVDVISMSFGFEKHHPDIRNAIIKTSKKDVVILL